MQSAVTLSVVMQSVIMLSVVAPRQEPTIDVKLHTRSVICKNVTVMVAAAAVTLAEDKSAASLWPRVSNGPKKFYKIFHQPEVGGRLLSRLQRQLRTSQSRELKSNQETHKVYLHIHHKLKVSFTQEMWVWHFR